MRKPFHEGFDVLLLWRLIITESPTKPGKGHWLCVRSPTCFPLRFTLTDKTHSPKQQWLTTSVILPREAEAPAGQAPSNREESRAYLDDWQQARHGGCVIRTAQGSKERSSKAAAHQNRLRDLWKHNAASVPRVSGSEDLGPKICISYKFPVGADAAGLGTTLWESLIQKMDSTAHLTGSKCQLCHLVALWRSASDLVSVPQLSHL